MRATNKTNDNDKETLFYIKFFVSSAFEKNEREYRQKKESNNRQPRSRAKLLKSQQKIVTHNTLPVCCSCDKPIPFRIYLILCVCPKFNLFLSLLHFICFLLKSCYLILYHPTKRCMSTNVHEFEKKRQQRTDERVEWRKKNQRNKTKTSTLMWINKNTVKTVYI